MINVQAIKADKDELFKKPISFLHTLSETISRKAYNFVVQDDLKEQSNALRSSFARRIKMLIYLIDSYYMFHIEI